MNIDFSKFKPCFSLHSLALIIGIFTLLSCAGGGTTGTDSGGSLRVLVSGKIKDNSGKPLSKVQVVISQTGDFALTDEAGVFQIESNVNPEPLLLEIATNKTSGTLDLGSPSESKSNFAIEISIDEDAGVIKLLSLTIIPRNPTPTPDVVPPTRAPGQIPSKQPTATPQPTPTTRSGIANVLFQGTIVDQSGQTASGLEVRILGKKDNTNSAGKFEVDTIYRGGSILITIENKRNFKVATATLSPIPVEDSIVVLTLEASSAIKNTNNNNNRTPTPNEPPISLKIRNQRITPR